jgi:hypothetical protein
MGRNPREDGDGSSLPQWYDPSISMLWKLQSMAMGDQGVLEDERHGRGKETTYVVTE